MLTGINFSGFTPTVSGMLLLSCCLLPVTHVAVAADWFEVEAVLFEYTEPDAGGEWWYENPGLPSRHQSIGLIMGTAVPVKGATPESAEEAELMPYLALPEQAYRLGGVRRVLERSAEYRPLLHVAWQQPGLDVRDVRSIHLDNTRYGKKIAEPDEARADTESEQPEYTPPDKVFDGIIRLRRSRFLHLDVDVAYFPDVLEQPGLEAGDGTAGRVRLPANYVRLTESRRVKPDELHYFDHPLFGLIVQVRKIISTDDAD